jgi:hypothetical protein
MVIRNLDDDDNQLNMGGGVNGDSHLGCIFGLVVAIILAVAIGLLWLREGI